MSEPFVVVHPSFCPERDVQLDFEEHWSASGNHFQVTDAVSKTPWFKIDGTAVSFGYDSILQDVTGDVLAHMRHPRREGLTPRMAVHGPGFSFEVIKKFKLQHEVKAEVTEVTSQKRRAVYMYGRRSARKMVLYLGKRHEGGRMLAYCERPRTWSVRKTCELSVLQGADAALCVIMCVAFDAFHNGRQA